MGPCLQAYGGLSYGSLWLQGQVVRTGPREPNATLLCLAPLYETNVLRDQIQVHWLYLVTGHIVAMDGKDAFILVPMPSLYGPQILSLHFLLDKLSMDNQSHHLKSRKLETFGQINRKQYLSPGFSPFVYYLFASSFLCS